MVDTIVPNSGGNGAVVCATKTNALSKYEQGLCSSYAMVTAANELWEAVKNDASILCILSAKGISLGDPGPVASEGENKYFPKVAGLCEKDIRRGNMK